MPLPFRKASLISTAMDEARAKAMGALTQAMLTYMEQVKQLTYNVKLEPGGSFTSNFAEHRRAIERMVIQFTTTQNELRKTLMVAFEEYDVNAAEIEAWLTAARASDKIVNS